MFPRNIFIYFEKTMNFILLFEKYIENEIYRERNFTV